MILDSSLSLTDGLLVEILRISGSNLRVLDLSCTDITGIGLEEEVNCLPNLETLSLVLCEKLTDGGLVEILRISRRKLRVLNLSSSTITGIGLEKGVKSLPMLENLDLSSLTGRGLAEILSISRSKLRSLNINRIRINRVCLEAVVQSLPMLENLDLRLCEDLDDFRLLEILRICGSKLRVLNVSAGGSITGLGLQKARNSYPMLDLRWNGEKIIYS